MKVTAQQLRAGPRSQIACIPQTLPLTKSVFYACYLTAPCLSFPIYKMGRTSSLCRKAVRIKWVNIHKLPRIESDSINAVFMLAIIRIISIHFPTTGTFLCKACCVVENLMHRAFPFFLLFSFRKVDNSNQNIALLPGKAIQRKLRSFTTCWWARDQNSVFCTASP